MQVNANICKCSQYSIIENQKPYSLKPKVSKTEFSLKSNNDYDYQFFFKYFLTLNVYFFLNGFSIR